MISIGGVLKRQQQQCGFTLTDLQSKGGCFECLVSSERMGFLLHRHSRVQTYNITVMNSTFQLNKLSSSSHEFFFRGGGGGVSNVILNKVPIDQPTKKKGERNIFF